MMLSDKEFEDEMLALELLGTTVMCKVREAVGAGEDLPPAFVASVYDGATTDAKEPAHDGRIIHTPPSR